MLQVERLGLLNSQCAEIYGLGSCGQTQKLPNLPFCATNAVLSSWYYAAGLHLLVGLLLR